MEDQIKVDANENDGEPIFEWFAAHNSTYNIPKWVRNRIDPKYSDQSQYFGRLFYYKFGATARKRLQNKSKATFSKKFFIINDDK